jgi:hypothetical protein
MTRSTRKVRQAVVFSAALALVAAGLAYAGQDTTITKSFKVEPGGKLVLDTDIGSVEVRGTAAGAVDIRVEREVRNGHDEKILDEFKLGFEQRGNDVYVTGEYDRHGLSRLFENLWNKFRVRFVIAVPSAYNADLRTSGGGITVSDLKGEVVSKTSGGSLHFDKITGNVRGNTSGGSIKAGFVDGDVDVHTSGGDIRIEETKGRVLARTSGGGIRISKAWGEVDADTSGGSITAEEVMGALRADTSGGSVTATILSQPKSRCSLSTSGGSITVTLAADIAMDVNAHASGGHVSTDFPVTIQGKIERSSLQAKINGGGPELYLRTSGGGIHIKKR